MKKIIKYFKENKKKIIINFIIFTLVALSCLTLDQITKHYINNKHSSGNWDQNYKILGFRFAKNTGMLLSLGENLPLWSVQLITSLIAAPLIIGALFSNRYYLCMALSFIGVGALGNIIDRYTWGFVVDFIYIPWIKNGNAGTFNLADVFVITGSLTMLVSMLIILFKSRKTN